MLLQSERTNTFIKHPLCSSGATLSPFCCSRLHADCFLPQVSVIVASNCPHAEAELFKPVSPGARGLPPKVSSAPEAPP